MGAKSANYSRSLFVHLIKEILKIFTKPLKDLIRTVEYV